MKRWVQLLATAITSIVAFTDASPNAPVKGILLEQCNWQEAEKSSSPTRWWSSHWVLYMAPESVDMSRAVKDYLPCKGTAGLTRDPNKRGVYSPTGSWGDPTLATCEKGEKMTEALVAGILREIEELRRSAVNT